MLDLTFCDNPDLEVITGSHLYGVSTPTSDTDYRGFVVEPIRHLVGIDKFEQREYDNEDRVIYGLAKFFSVLRNGNTNCMEVLFSPLQNRVSKYGKLVLEHRDLFISKAYYRSIRGFALSEMRKARAVSLVTEFSSTEEEDMFKKIFGKYQLKRYEIEEILDIIFTNREGDPRKEVSSSRFLGARRKEDVEKHGLSLKNAYHAIRLLDEGIELMNTGKLIFPRPISGELRAIRNGEVSLDEIVKRFEGLDKDLAEAAKKSSLPDRANVDKINELYMSIVSTKIREEIDSECAINER